MVGFQHACFSLFWQLEASVGRSWLLETQGHKFPLQSPLFNLSPKLVTRTFYDITASCMWHACVRWFGSREGDKMLKLIKVVSMTVCSRAQWYHCMLSIATPSLSYQHHLQPLSLLSLPPSVQHSFSSPSLLLFIPLFQDPSSKWLDATRF